MKRGGCRSFGDVRLRNEANFNNCLSLFNALLLFFLLEAVVLNLAEGVDGAVVGALDCGLVSLKAA
jgi:hypothetical protein